MKPADFFATNFIYMDNIFPPTQITDKKHSFFKTFIFLLILLLIVGLVWYNMAKKAENIVNTVPQNLTDEEKINIVNSLSSNSTTSSPTLSKTAQLKILGSLSSKTTSSNLTKEQKLEILKSL